MFQPHRYTRTAALWRDFADAFVGADARRAHRRVRRRASRRSPGVSGRLVLRAVLDAHPEQPVTYLPRRADLVAHVPRLARPGDLVLTLGAGDLTTAARRVAGARPRDASTPPSVGRWPSSAARCPGRGRARRPARRAHHLPRRWPGRGAGRGSAARPTLARRRPAWSREHVPPLLRRRAGLQPARGRRRVRRAWASCSTASSSTVDLDAGRRARSGPGGGGAAARCSPAGAAGAGRAGLEFFVGIPGSVGGAVRMNAGGHGRETAEVLVAARDVVDLGRAGAATGRATVGRPRLRLPPLGARRRRGRDRRRASRVGAGRAEACEARDRRDRALAARAPARRRERGLGVPQPAGRLRRAGSSTPPGSRGSGSVARSCRAKHANFFQAEPGATADDVHAPGASRCGGGCSTATGVALVPELRMVGFDDATVTLDGERTVSTARPAASGRRRRRHAVAARRADGRRRLRIARARRRARGARAGRGWGASISPLLDVDHVAVRGHRARSPPTQVQDGGADRRAATRSSWLDVGAGRAPAIEALPVGRATREVEREWPDTVRIAVRERRPVAWVDGRRRARAVVDAHRPRARGRRRRRPPACRSCSARKLVPPGRAARSTPVDGARVAGALTGLAAGGHGVGRGHRPRRACSTSSHGPEIRLGRPTQIAAKVRAAVAVLGALAGVEVRPTST